VLICLRNAANRAPASLPLFFAVNITFHAEQILRAAIDALAHGHPSFMLRMGDGEMILANADEKRLDAFCRKQFARTISTEELETAQRWMHDAVLDSTILGLPTQQHCRKSPLWTGLFEYYQGLEAAFPKRWVPKTYCTINAHFELLQSGALFSLLGKVEKITIVSPRQVAERLKARFPNIQNVEYYSIPAEQQYEVVKSRSVDVFGRLADIMCSLSSEPRQGQLLLFGAGPLGKSLGSCFSRAGGVALDLGSVFDLFVGKKTRGQGKGATATTEPML
jgi:hypothetical protein